MILAANNGKAMPAHHARALSYTAALDNAQRALSKAAALRNGWRKLRCAASLERYRAARADWKAATAALAAVRPAAGSDTASAVKNPILRYLDNRANANKNRSHLGGSHGQSAKRERESFSYTKFLDRSARNKVSGKRHDRATIKRRAETASLEARLVGWNRDRWRAVKVYSDRIRASAPVKNCMTGPNNADRENWRTVKHVPAQALNWATEHRVSTRAVTAIPLPDPTDKQRARASNANGVPMVAIGHGHTARHRIILPDPVDAEHRARRLTRRERRDIKR